MKRILFSLLFAASFLQAIAQPVEAIPTLVGKATVSQTGSGAGYWQVAGNFTDESGYYSSSDLQVGDILFFTDAGVGYHLPITVIVSATPPSFEVRVNNAGIAGVLAVPTGPGAFYRPSAIAIGPYTSGLTGADQQTLNNYMTQLLSASGGSGGPDSTWQNITGGFLNKTPAVYVSRTGKTRAPILDKGGAVFNVEAYGVLPNGADMTSQFLALLDTVKRSGGGEIRFGRGTFRFNGKVLVPSNPTNATRNGRSVVRNVDMLWAGSGSYATGFSNPDTFSQKGTVIELYYSGDTLGRIDTRGLGRLTIRDIAFRSPVANPTPFILTTNTTLDVQSCSFTGVGVSGNETVFQLGTNGTATEYWSNGADECFQGYGSVFRNNFFNGIGTGFYLKSNANAIVIDGNTFWWRCGGYAAIRLEPVPVTIVGNVISNNLIEMNGYQYGIVLGRTSYNSLTNNNFYDNEYGSIANILHKNFPFPNRIIQGARGQSTQPDFVEQGPSGVTDYVAQGSADTSSIRPPTNFWAPIWLHQDSLAIVSGNNRKVYHLMRLLGYNNYSFGFSSPTNVSKEVYSISETNGDITKSWGNVFGRDVRVLSKGFYSITGASNYAMVDTTSSVGFNYTSLLNNSGLILSSESAQPGDHTGYGTVLSFQPYRNRTAYAGIAAIYETSNANDNLKLDFLIKTGGSIRVSTEMNARGVRVFGNYFDHFTDGVGANDRNYTWANNYFNTGYYSLLRNSGSGAVPTLNVMTFDRDGLLCVSCTDPQERMDLNGNLRIRPQSGTGTLLAALNPNGVVTRSTIPLSDVVFVTGQSIGQSVRWSGSAWAPYTPPVDVSRAGVFTTTSNSKGLVVSGDSIQLAAASVTNPGGVSTTTQTFGGAKTIQVNGSSPTTPLTLSNNSDPSGGVNFPVVLAGVPYFRVEARDSLSGGSNPLTTIYQRNSAGLMVPMIRLNGRQGIEFSNSIAMRPLNQGTGTRMVLNGLKSVYGVYGSIDTVILPKIIGTAYPATGQVVLGTSIWVNNFTQGKLVYLTAAGDVVDDGGVTRFISPANENIQFIANNAGQWTMRRTSGPAMEAVNSGTTLDYDGATPLWIGTSSTITTVNLPEIVTSNPGANQVLVGTELDITINNASSVTIARRGSDVIWRDGDASSGTSLVTTGGTFFTKKIRAVAPLTWAVK